MKRLMISAHPEWVEKILNGEKTIEVRPWITKGELPLEVLIYVTKGKPNESLIDFDKFAYVERNERYRLVDLSISSVRLAFQPTLCGKVVAKFILNKAEDFNPKLGHPKLYINACVSDTELVKLYPNKNILFAWKIDDLVIFDKPKELGEFYHYKKKLIDCGMDCPPYIDEVKVPLTKAPQKMVWIEEL